jgi:MFS family permease
MYVTAAMFQLDVSSADMFVHSLMVTSGGAFGGIFAGYIVKASTDWRWVFWMDTILTAICLLLVVLFLPETNFRRPVHLENNEESETILVPVTTIEHKSKLTLWDALSISRGYDRYFAAQLFIC